MHANLRRPLAGGETGLSAKGEIGVSPDTLGSGEEAGPETQQANKDWEWHRSNLLSRLSLELFNYDIPHINMNSGHDACYKNGRFNGDMCGVLGGNKMGTH
ncbi:hypothetical protein HAX54_004286 [Datura stramonium]|uniref:Uncharacterized protein n=1 Tax=Datura stramonium TaxID=4076 RepID=A0ABS8WSS9_DATST|nr:hypothetical protein [Datura stramonium]